MPPSVTLYSFPPDAPPDVARLAALVREHLPALAPRRILVKPNWVRHAEADAFPIAALVTSTALVEAVVVACRARYPDAELITVGDVPLQDCDWERLGRQAGLAALAARLEALPGGPRVLVRDLRRERYALVEGFLRSTPNPAGDPCGYRDVVLGRESFLDPLTAGRNAFRVSDYDARVTEAGHRPGAHRYLVAGSVLAADLVINLPKLKTHQKAGLTGALKNLVGMNGEKGLLVHYRQGTPRQGGDEFAPDTPWAVRWQVRVRERLQKRSRVLFALLRQGWRVLRRVQRIETQGTRANLDRNFYMAGGAWYGNDTLWRMIYDLNRIVRYAAADGTLCATPQRACLSIVDGLVAGEGNGPLQPLPVPLGLIGASVDPFALDHVLARLMGFDYRRLPQLAHAADFARACGGGFDAEALSVAWDGRSYAGVSTLPVARRFLPAPGWRGRIELPEETP